MNTLAGDMLTRDGSLLNRAIVTPPGGAAADRLTGNEDVPPKLTVALAGSTTLPRLVTEMVTVAGALAVKISLTINCTT